jgi:hypothetical protein
LIGAWPSCPEKYCGCNIEDTTNGCDWKCACTPDHEFPGDCPVEIASTGCGSELQLSYPQCFVATTLPLKETCSACPEKTCHCDKTLPGCDSVCEPCELKECPEEIATVGCDAIEHISVAFPECYVKGDASPRTCVDCPEQHCHCDVNNVMLGCDWKCLCPPESEPVTNCQDPATLT